MNYLRESEYIEFKESLSQLNRGLEALVAMLNKHGRGTIVFGVKDNGEVIGISIGNKTSKDISEAITTRVRPTIVPTIEEEEIDGKTVVRIEATGHNKPYAFDGKYLIRSGNENKKIEPEIMRELLFSSSKELMTNIESFDQELTFNQLRQLFVSKGLSINEATFNKNNGFYTKGGKYNLLANVLADNNNFSIKVVKFSGIDKSDMVSRTEYGYKCLILAMLNALDAVYVLNETRVDLTNMVRKDIPLFDNSSFREAWINACLHTRWDKMVPPAIYIFKNRMEIVSTGGLPIDYTIDDFYQGVSNPINKDLQKIMGQLGLVEQTGHGVPEIIKHYGKEAFTITDNHIIVTLKFPFEIKMGESNLSSLSSSHASVLQAITNNPFITTKQLEAVVGLKSSRISTIVSELKALNRITRVGSNKNGYWQVNK